MIHWAGAFGLALALCSSVLAAAGWGRAAATGNGSAVGRAAVVGCLAGSLVAVAALEYALLTHDFSVRFVAENGSRATPAYYTVTSLWAAHDGSLLLWTAILAGYLTVLSLRAPAGAATLHRWAVAVTAAVTAFFAGLAVFSSHVFDRVTPVPADGPGPTPLLQDHPAMGIHPPLLYLGLVGLVVPFAYGVAGLVCGQVDGRWLSAVRGYAAFAWTALTAGILLGAWWSYTVLGWGGYWSWDPVENASLMPWLLGTALLHSAMVQRRRGALAVWNLTLAVSAFLLAALGVLLTRSGLVSSVHSFADSQVGPVLLGFLAALVVGVLALVALRGGALAPARPLGPVLARGTALLLNNVVLVALMVTVLLGTVLPVVVASASGAEVSVGPPYFNRTAVPLAVLLLLLMAVGPVLRWGGDSVARVWRTLAPSVLVAAVTVVVTGLVVGGSAVALLAFGLAAFVGAGVVTETAPELRGVLARGRGTPAVAGWLRRRRGVLGARLAHLGVAVAAVGIAASSGYAVSVERHLSMGDSVSVGGATATLRSVDRIRSDRAMQTDAVVSVTDGDSSRQVRPALRFYPAHGSTVAAPAVSSSVTRDLYLTLLSVDQDGTGATLRLAVNPMVGWLWTGGLLVVLGSAVAAWPGSRRRPGRGPTDVDAAREAISRGPVPVP